MNDEAKKALALHWPSGGCGGSIPTPVHRNVGAVSTTRCGGGSSAPFDSFNLGLHVGDDPGAVEQNRRRFMQFVGDDVQMCWLSQVHGTDVVRAEDVAESEGAVEADACVSRTPSLGCVVLTADCLPVLLSDRGGTVVAAAHAGWRGLAAGVLEATVRAMDTSPGELIAWLGPAIGADVFEVGEEVREQFVSNDAGADGHFQPSPFNPDDRWVADLVGLARRRLRSAGVEAVFAHGGCTYSDDERFFSYRRDGTTGRMATAIWLRGE